MARWWVAEREPQSITRRRAAKRGGDKVGLVDKVRHAAGDRLALSRIRNALGPNDPVLITGAAPIGT